MIFVIRLSTRPKVSELVGEIIQENEKISICYNNEFDEEVKCDTFKEFAFGGKGMKRSLQVGKDLVLLFSFSNL